MTKVDKKRIFEFYEKEGHRKHHQGKLLQDFPDLYKNITILLKQQAAKPLAVFVDVGCAEGHHVSLMSRYAEISLGIDVSLPKLKRFKSTKNSFVIQADAEHLPFKPGVIALILCCITLEHLMNPLNAVKESYLALKPDGNFILAVPQDHSNIQIFNLIKDIYLKLKKVNANPLSDGSGGHLHSFSPKQVQRLIKSSGLINIYMKYLSDLRFILNDLMLLLLKRAFKKDPNIYIVANKPTEQ